VYGGYGENIYSAFVSQYLTLKDSKFRSFHNSVYSSGYSLSISGCNFEGNGKDRAAIGNLNYRSNGGGLFIEKTSKI